MSRILLLGAGPLAADPRVSAGPAFRATQFILPLRGAGHEIVFASLAGPDADNAAEKPIAGGGTMIEFSPEAMFHGAALRRLGERLRPQAIVGCGTILADYAAARLSDLAPTWIDLYGDPIAEIQAKAEAYPELDLRSDLRHVASLYQACLRRADRISAVSRAQSHAVVGCLGLVGRLNASTAGQSLVHTIPCGVLPRFGAVAATRRFRGVKCAQDDFLVAWGGSYNTWMDSDLLFDGVTRAMERLPQLRFVSTGGGSAGYNEKVYERFAERVRSSPHAGRFHLFGWIGRDEAEAIHRECDVGLNIDRWCYEGVLGARNRIINFLDLGVPVATTILSEVSRDLEAAGGVIPLPLGDANALASTLVDLCSHPERLRQTAARGQAFVRERYEFRRTVEPLLEWAAAPRRAGDYRAEGKRDTPVADRMDFDAAEAFSSRPSWARRFLRRLKGRLSR
ncbi:MAG: hypothetical protein NTW86_26680 [Candidatus Sumerlaeota bacterium]|nr:hypothetical protein [Candidatus Sumerlaeota bacterium]